MSDSVEKRGTSSSQVPSGSRRTYDANFKLMVVKYAEATNNCAAGRKYEVSEPNVRRWRTIKEKLENANSSRKSFSGPKKGRFHELEERVVNYVREKRNEGFPVTHEVIRMKAIELSRNIPNMPKFKASTGWCVRMMRRAGLTLRRRTSLAQKLPAEYSDKLLQFQRHVIALRKEHSYMLSQIGNADETPVYFDMPSNTTIDDKGAKSVIIKGTGNEKARMTVMLGVLADGHKLPPYVILRRKTLPKEKLPAGLIFRCQEKGWMTNDLMLDWVKVVWSRRSGALLKKRGMLVLDSFKGHLTQEVKEEVKKANTDLVVIPGGMSSQLQVLDVVVNKPFKDHLRQLYNDWLLEGYHALTPSGKLKKPSVALLGEWILTAWGRISSDSIVTGFKKCCISNALDGTEDDILWREESNNYCASESEDGDCDESDGDSQ